MKILRIVAVIVVVSVGIYFLIGLLAPVKQADKLARIIHLEDRRELSGRLKDYLDDPDPAVRARAALAVGRIGGKGSAEPLMDLLADSVWEVATMAATAVGFTGDRDIPLTLLETADNLPPRMTARAAEAAGRLADSSSADVLAALKSYLSHPAPEVREQAILALFRSGDRSPAGEIILLHQREPDDLVRQACLYYLSQFGVTDAAGVYVDYLADPDPDLRSLAVRGMGSVNTDDARRYASIALNDVAPRVVAASVAALAKSNDPAIADLLTRKLAVEEDPNVIAAIIEALQRLDSETGLTEAERVAVTYPDPPVIAATVRYNAAIRKGRALDLIDSLLRVERPLVRAACAEGLGLIQQNNVIPRLTTLFKDPAPSVRVAALTTLLAADSANQDFYLRQALDDTDWVVRSVAVDAIGERRLASYLPLLKERFDPGKSREVDLRRSIIGALRPFLLQGADSAVVLPILRAGLTDPSYIVRRESSDLWDKFVTLPKSAVSLIAETRIDESDIKDALARYVANPRAKIVTNEGDIEVELYVDVAPLTVLNFISLAEDGFYDRLTFHRVVPNFVIQGGDPRGDGWGGPGYLIRDEYSSEPYVRGSLGIATSGKDTGGSQFFITLSPQPRLEGRYTVFGRVIGSMETADRIAVGDTIRTITIEEGRL